ncbi:ribonuclease H-like domain-containing protein [Tanacetum coccineum]
MLAQPTEDEGAVSERPSETQPTPSPTHPSEDQSEPQPDPFLRPSSSNPIPDSIPEGSGGNHGGQSSSDRSLSGNEDGLTLQSVYDLCVSLCKQVTTQAAQIKDLKAQIKQLKKKAKPVISHHNAWIKSVSMKKRLARKKSLKTKLMQKESVSKQGRKPAKSEPTVHKDPAFDDLDDAMDYMETEDAHDEGTVKDSEETRVSTEDQVSTDKLKVSTDKPNEGTAEPNEGTAEPKDGNSDESAAPTTVFRDDETIAQFLVTMSQNKTKQKGFEIKEIKDTDRPRTTTERSILTLKPLPKIDPKDKGKKVLEEKAKSNAESEGVNEAEKKFKILANDEEIARKVQEEWETEEEKKNWLRKKLLWLHLPVSMTIFKQDLMQTRFLLRSFKKKREKSSPLSKERSFFMIPLLHKEDFLLNKEKPNDDILEIWAAIKSRFGGNEESKKMQKNVLKHQFENFTTASNESLDKAYVVPAGKVIIIVSTGRLSLVPTGRILSPGFVVPAGLLTVSSASIIACHPFFAQPTTSPQLENEDFQQIDEDDLEELDLRWQVAMLTVRVRKFIQKTGRNMDFKEKRLVSLDKSKIKCYNCHRKGHFARECRSGRNQGRRSYGDNGRSNAPTNESSSQALVAQDGLGGYDWSNDFEVEPVNYALMAISSSSSSSSSDNEGYELALESLESRILVHEKNELAWGEKYEFQNYELKCREIKINNLNLELEKVVKERDELKLKIEKWEESSKNLDELLNSQMSARDKTGLGYGTQLNEMSNNSETDSEISLSVFDVRSPRNFLTPRADISFAGLDEYAIRKKIIESKTTNLNTKTSETVGKTNEANTQKPKTVYESVNRDKVIIEDWNSDDEDDVSGKCNC